MKYEKIALVIPHEFKFEELKLSRSTDGITFKWDLIKSLCEYNNLDVSIFKNQHEDNVSGLIVNWYMHHRKSGGKLNQIAEQIIAEIVAESKYGRVNIISGADKQ